MNPDFSEFSYGYAVTEELAKTHKAHLLGAPIFPSLYEEGKVGGGYDMKIPMAGKAIFIQFKLSDYLERTNAKEHRDGVLSVPYYRMHIRPIKHSDQHNLLLELENSGETVFYIAPEFHLPRELNEFYLNSSVVQNSAAFSPGVIGPMPDDEEHYLVFKRGTSEAYRCSDNRKPVRKSPLNEGLISLLNQRDVKHIDFNDRYFNTLVDNMLSVLRESEERLKRYKKSIDINGIERIVQNRNPVDAIGYMARTFYDSELLIVPEL